MKMVNNFWDTGIEIISLVKEIWQEPTALKLETLRVRMNEEIEKRTKTEAAISELAYSKERLRFIERNNEAPIRLFLYAFFPQKLVQTNNPHLELLKDPEDWISSNEVK